MAADNTKTILFVDDESSVLSSLRRLMRKEGWNLLFAQSGLEGLEKLKEQEVDLVVSDMRMPNMDGATFLKKVQQLYPDTTRIVLTGFAERSSVTEAFSNADIYELIPKPWDDDELKQVLHDALEHAHDHEHARPGLHKIINEIDALPPLPNTYAELRKALRKTQVSSTEPVAKVIVSDPMIAARILQVANSAFFGQRRKVDTISRAIFVLGLELVQNLVMSAGAFQTMHFPRLAHLKPEELWQHALSCGVIARYIAEIRKWPETYQETAMLAGTMHELGKLVLAKYVTEPYGQILESSAQSQTPLIDVERQQLGTTHASVGGYLAQWWNLPQKIVDAVRHHHDPEKAQTDPQLAHLIHLSNALAHRLELGSSGPVRETGIAPTTYETIGLSPRAIDQLEERLQGIELLPTS